MPVRLAPALASAFGPVQPEGHGETVASSWAIAAVNSRPPRLIWFSQLAGLENIRSDHLFAQNAGKLLHFTVVARLASQRLAYGLHNRLR